MKFAHISDTHLGRRSFKLTEREKDFERVFTEAIDKIIQEKVDFVIHSGDIFDTGKPDINTMIFCAQQLSRLKQENIPMFIIPGSHDIGYGETKSVIQLFDELGLVKNLSGSKYYQKKEDKVILKGEVYKDAFICGVWGRKSRIKDFFSKIQPEFSQGKFKILMFHHIIPKVGELFAEIDNDSLPRGFDYYAGGHWHGREELQYDNKPLIYAGSTENCDANEIQRNQEKGFYINENGSLRFVKLNTRPIVIKEIDCNNLSSDEVMKKVESLEKTESKSILFLKMYGKLKGKRREIDRALINKDAIEKGYFIAKTSLSELKEEGEKAEISVENKSSDNIEKEYLEAQKYSEKQIDLAKMIMDYLGSKLPPREIETKTKELIDKIGVWYENQ